MKKIVLPSILIIGAALSIYVIMTIYPKPIQFNAQGIKYRLGDENTGLEKSINVSIKGKLYSSMTGNKTFKGTITIEGEEIPVPENQRELEIHFRKERHGGMVYFYIEDGMPYLFHYGAIYTDRTFSKVTFMVFDREKEDKSRGTWNADNGLMISAPASNRVEAVRISNELMNKYLNGNILK